MIQILRIATAGPNGVGYASYSDLTRFAFVSNMPVVGSKHLEFRFDGVSDPRFSLGTTIAKHPLAKGVPSVDHHEPAPALIQIDAWLSSPLTTDQEGDSRTQTTVYNADDDALIQVIPSNARNTGLTARAQDALTHLRRVIGVPCTVYLPRFGVFGPYSLVGVEASHSERAKVSFNLSFEQVRIASNIGVVLLPMIPRVRIQEPPTTEQASWWRDGANGIRDPGPSVLQVSIGPEFGPNPDRPLANQQFEAVDRAATPMGSLLDSYLSGSLSR